MQAQPEVFVPLPGPSSHPAPISEFWNLAASAEV